MFVSRHGKAQYSCAYVDLLCLGRGIPRRSTLGDDGDVCALCCTKFDPEKMSMCDKCELQYCTDCIDTHTCDSVTFL